MELLSPHRCVFVVFITWGSVRTWRVSMLPWYSRTVLLHAMLLLLLCSRLHNSGDPYNSSLLPLTLQPTVGFSSLSHKRHDFLWIFTAHKMCVLIFSANLYEMCLVLIRNEGYMLTNLYWSSRSYQILINLEFLDIFSFYSYFFFFFFFFFFLFFFFFHWHYSPLCALACRTMSFHFFLSATISLYLLTPSTWRSLSTFSFHLFLGFPLLLVPSGSWLKIFLGILSSSILSRWPNQLIICPFIHFTIFSPLLISSSSWLVRLFHSPLSYIGPYILLNNKILVAPLFCGCSVSVMTCRQYWYCIAARDTL